MSQPLEEQDTRDVLHVLREAIDDEDIAAVRDVLDEMHPAEIALLLESLPKREREVVWEQLDPEQHTDVLAEVEDAVRTTRMLAMKPDELAAVVSELDADDAADMLQSLPEDVIEEVLRSLDEQNRLRVQSVLVYGEDTAGGLMNTDVVTVRADVDLEVVLRYLRWRGEIPEKTNRLYVVDRDNHFLGVLRLADLLIHDPKLPVSGLIMEDEEVAILATTSSHDVAQLFEQRDLISAPVVDEQNRLLGRITFDDVMDVIRDEGDTTLLNMAGVDEDEDMFGPVLHAARRRTLWLGINLATAFLASWVIGLFEATIAQVVALAVLMPIVASMGGIAGTQTLTIVIRGMALGQIGTGNAVWLLRRELFVGLLNGVIWALAVGLVSSWWFDNQQLGMVIGAAMVINLLAGALAGATVPLLLKRLYIDPAVAGGVVLTTVTDVVGFVSFLGLGSMFLLAR